MIEVGDRVGAILGAENGRVEFLGYGVYEGKVVPDKPMGLMQAFGKTWDEVVESAKADGFPEAEAERLREVGNPKLLLDNGDVVWGAECWWDSEASVQRQLEAATEVVEVSIVDARANAEA